MSQTQNDFINNLHEFGINPRTREVFLHGNDESSEIDEKVAVQFEKNIYLLARQNKEPIYIHLNSVGGSIDDGLAIYDVIHTLPIHTVVIAHGCAASMGSLIPQAADLRLIMPNAQFMIHRGSFSVSETATGAITCASWHKKIIDLILDIYSARCSKGKFFKRPQYNTLDKVKKFLDKKMKEHEHWFLTAEEAVEYGFMDAVIGDNYTMEDILTKNIEFK